MTIEVKDLVFKVNEEKFTLDAVFTAHCSLNMEMLTEASLTDPSEMYRVVGRELMNAFVVAQKEREKAAL